ncbi:alkane 1-monooxygenase [Maritimibacter dapengensis]|uniref:Alkane 1-monooxygenase n=1 Tax=Maritimibacter dapengensis TaxID=2836868 RepID=A0ABS6SY63_9RHOB|nr:alkane 1-monooxygenase [Maritimibacter dapengensis]MBV7377902.1 alkane 1-monooxygenase [Maritimibacter dapengensis]
MTHPVRTYAIATLTPVVLIVAGAFGGGVWSWLALVYMTLFTFGLDQMIAANDPGENPARDLPAADTLSASLAVLHFALLPLVVWSISSAGHGIAPGVALFIGAGLFFGQVSNSNAHELIHRRDRRLFALGKWVYVTLLFGHHTSAHLKVHHRHAASPQDPNSARRGEGFYRFAWRAWIGSFREGYRAEREAIRKRGTGGTTPYVTYIAGAAAFALLALVFIGPDGLLAYVGLSAYAQMQLLLSDYVQHYGLTRSETAPGKYEPVGPAHSWNAGHWYSRHLMLNAPRHSDHHAHPARPYPFLRNAPDAPTLPSTLPAMAALALIPSLWRRVMTPALSEWEATRA